jgi:hypothetical protein
MLVKGGAHTMCSPVASNGPPERPERRLELLAECHRLLPCGEVAALLSVVRRRICRARLNLEQFPTASRCAHVPAFAAARPSLPRVVCCRGLGAAWPVDGTAPQAAGCVPGCAGRAIVAWSHAKRSTLTSTQFPSRAVKHNRTLSTSLRTTKPRGVASLMDTRSW